MLPLCTYMVLATAPFIRLLFVYVSKQRLVFKKFFYYLKSRHTFEKVIVAHPWAIILYCI